MCSMLMGSVQRGLGCKLGIQPARAGGPDGKKCGGNGVGCSENGLENKRWDCESFREPVPAKELERAGAGAGGVEEEGKLFPYCGDRVGLRKSPLKNGSDFVIWVDSVRRFFW